MVIDEVRAAVARWAKFADAAGLAKKAATMIGDSIAPVIANAVMRKSLAKTKAKSKP